jgi:hypothetical protein
MNIRRLSTHFISETRLAAIGAIDPELRALDVESKTREIYVERREEEATTRLVTCPGAYRMCPTTVDVVGTGATGLIVHTRASLEACKRGMR